jgi:excisionase family DNA binding protein
MATATAAPRWAPLRQAAEQNGIKYRTLLKWISEGRIQAHRFGPRLLQVDLDDLDALRVPVDLDTQGRARRAS